MQFQSRRITSKPGHLCKKSNVRPNRIFTADCHIVLYHIGHLRHDKISEVIERIVDTFLSVSRIGSYHPMQIVGLREAVSVSNTIFPTFFTPFFRSASFYSLTVLTGLFTSCLNPPFILYTSVYTIVQTSI